MNAATSEFAHARTHWFMNDATLELTALVRAHRQRLETVRGSIESALDNEIARLGRTPVSALIIAGLLENYCTCLETILLRNSLHFENRRDPARWHADLLQKMTLEIEGVRVTAVSEAAFSPLFELLKFRHFKRLLLRAGVRPGPPGLPDGQAAAGAPSGHAGPGPVRALHARGRRPVKGGPHATGPG